MAWRGYDTETAIAHDRGRDPERGRWRQGRVPGDLRVIMRVQVDDARHQREPAGIDDLGRVVANLADRDLYLIFPIFAGRQKWRRSVESNQVDKFERTT